MVDSIAGTPDQVMSEEFDSDFFDDPSITDPSVHDSDDQYSTAQTTVLAPKSKGIPGAYFGDLKLLVEASLDPHTVIQVTGSTADQAEAYTTQVTTEMSALILGAALLEDLTPLKDQTANSSFESLLQQSFLSPDLEAGAMYYQQSDSYGYGSVETSFVLMPEVEAHAIVLEARSAEYSQFRDQANLTDLKQMRDDLFMLETRSHRRHVELFLSGCEATLNRFEKHHLIDATDHHWAEQLIKKQRSDYEREKKIFDANSRQGFTQRFQKNLADFFQSYGMGDSETSRTLAELRAITLQEVPFSNMVTLIEMEFLSQPELAIQASEIFHRLRQERDQQQKDFEAWEEDFQMRASAEWQPFFPDSVFEPTQDDLTAYLSWIDEAYRAEWHRFSAAADLFPNQLTSTSYDGDLPHDLRFKVKPFKTEEEMRLFRLATGDTSETEHVLHGMDLHAATSERSRDGHVMERWPRIMTTGAAIQGGEAFIPPPDDARFIMTGIKTAHEFLAEQAEALGLAYYSDPVSALTAYVHHDWSDKRVSPLPADDHQSVPLQPQGTRLKYNPTRDYLIDVAQGHSADLAENPTVETMEENRFFSSREFASFSDDIAWTKERIVQRFSGDAINVVNKLNENSLPNVPAVDYTDLIVHTSVLEVLSGKKNLNELLQKMTQIYTRIANQIDRAIDNPRPPELDNQVIGQGNWDDALIVLKSDEDLDLVAEYFTKQKDIADGNLPEMRDFKKEAKRILWMAVIEATIHIMENHRDALLLAADDYFVNDHEAKQGFEKRYDDCLVTLKGVIDYTNSNLVLAKVDERIKTVGDVIKQAHRTTGLSHDVSQALQSWDRYNKCRHAAAEFESHLPIPPQLTRVTLTQVTHDFVSAEIPASIYAEGALPQVREIAKTDWEGMRSYVDLWQDSLRELEGEVYHYLWPKDAERFINRARFALYTMELELKKLDAAKNYPKIDQDGDLDIDMDDIVRASIADWVQTIPWGWPEPDGYSERFGVIDDEFKPDGSSYLNQEGFVFALLSTVSGSDFQKWHRLLDFLTDYYLFFCPSFAKFNEVGYPVRSIRSHDVYNRLLLVLKSISRQSRDHLQWESDEVRQAHIESIRDVSDQLQIGVSGILESQGQDPYWYNHDPDGRLTNIYPVSVRNKTPELGLGDDLEFAVTKSRRDLYQAYDDPFAYFSGVVTDYGMSQWIGSKSDDEAFSQIDPDLKLIDAYELGLRDARTMKFQEYATWYRESAWEAETMYAIGRISERLNGAFLPADEARYQEVQRTIQSTPKEAIQAWLTYFKMPKKETDTTYDPIITHFMLTEDTAGSEELADRFLLFAAHEVSQQHQTDPSQSRFGIQWGTGIDEVKLDSILPLNFLRLLNSLTPAELLWATACMKQLIYTNQNGSEEVDEFRVASEAQRDVDHWLFTLSDEEVVSLSGQFMHGYDDPDTLLSTYPISKIHELIGDDDQLARLILIDALARGNEDISQPIHDHVSQMIRNDALYVTKLTESMLQDGIVPLSMSDKLVLANHLIQDVTDQELEQYFQYARHSYQAKEVKTALSAGDVRVALDVIKALYAYGPDRCRTNITQTVSAKLQDNDSSVMGEVLERVFSEDFGHLFTKQEHVQLAGDVLSRASSDGQAPLRFARLTWLKYFDAASSFELAQKIDTKFPDEPDQQKEWFQRRTDYINGFAHVAPLSEQMTENERLYAFAWLSLSLYVEPSKTSVTKLRETLTDVDSKFDAQHVEEFFKDRSLDEKEYFLRLYDSILKEKYVINTRTILTPGTRGAVIQMGVAKKLDDNAHLIQWLDDLLKDPENTWAIKVTDPHSELAVIYDDLISEMDTKLEQDLGDEARLDPVTAHVLDGVFTAVTNTLSQAVDQGEKKLSGNLRVMQVLHAALLNPRHEDTIFRHVRLSRYNPSETQMTKATPEGVMTLNQVYRLATFDQVNPNVVYDLRTRREIESLLKTLLVIMENDLPVTEREELVQTWGADAIDFVLAANPNLEKKCREAYQRGTLGLDQEELNRRLKYIEARLTSRPEELRLEAMLKNFDGTWQEFETQYLTSPEQAQQAFADLFETIRPSLNQQLAPEILGTDGSPILIERPQLDYRQELNRRLARAKLLTEIVCCKTTITDQEIPRYALKPMMMQTLDEMQRLGQNERLAENAAQILQSLGLNQPQYHDPHPIELRENTQTEVQRLFAVLSIQDKLIAYHFLAVLIEQCERTQDSPWSEAARDRLELFKQEFDDQDSAVKEFFAH